MSFINDIEAETSLTRINPGQPLNKMHERVGTIRTRRFIEAITDMGMTAEDAAAYVGIDFEELQRLVEDSEVRDYIERQIRIRKAKHTVTRDRVISMLFDTVRQGKQLGDVSSQVSAIREMNKMEGLHAPEKKEMHLSKDAKKLQRALSTLDDAELVKIASGDDIVDAEYTEVEDVEQDS